MALKKKEPSKKRDRAASEKALIQAATQLFASKGFDGTRTLEIARKAKVNEALITRYFGGKEGLLVAVLERSEATLTSQALAPDANPNHSESQPLVDPADWIPAFDPKKNFKASLREFFKAGLRHFEEQESLIRIALSQALIDPKMGEMLRKKTLEQSLPKATAQMKKFFGSRVSASDLESLVMLLLASNYSLNFMGRVVHRIDDKRVDRVLNLLIDALVAKHGG